MTSPTRDKVAALLRDNVQTLDKDEEWHIADMLIALFERTSNADGVSLEVPADAPTKPELDPLMEIPASYMRISGMTGVCMDCGAPVDLTASIPSCPDLACPGKTNYVEDNV